VTHYRAKPTGWADDIDVVKGRELDILDDNQSTSVDGTAGGTYTLTEELKINSPGGLKSSKIKASTLVGQLEVASVGEVSMGGKHKFTGYGKRPYRIDRNNILNVYGTGDTAFHSVGLRYDIYTCSVTITAAMTWTINDTGCVDGEIIKITYNNSFLTPFACTIRSSTGPTNIATSTTADIIEDMNTVVFNFGHGTGETVVDHAWVRLVFNGSSGKWQYLDSSRAWNSS